MVDVGNSLFFLISLSLGFVPGDARLHRFWLLDDVSPLLSAQYKLDHFHTVNSPLLRLCMMLAVGDSLEELLYSERPV